MSHVTQMHESCPTCEWVTSHRTKMKWLWWISHVMSESCHTYGWVMSHIWMSHVTHVDELCHTYGWVMSHIWMSHVPQDKDEVDFMYIYACMYVCMHICICICICIYICIYTYTYTYTSISWDTYTYTYTYICMYMSIYIYVYVNQDKDEVDSMLINETCDAYVYIYESFHIWVSHVPHINESCPTGQG